MLPVKTIARAFLTAVGIYLLLALPWPGVREVYRDAFRWTCTTLLGNFGSEGTVRFELPSEKDRANPNFRPTLDDTVVAMERRTVTYEEIRRDDGRIARVPKTEGAANRVAIQSGRIGYVPMVLMIALVLATPVPWSRRWRCVAWGMLWINLFVIFRLTLMLLINYSQIPVLKQFDFGPFGAKLLSLSYEFFFVAPACTVLAPAFVWGMVALRREDVARIASISQNKPLPDSPDKKAD